MATGSKVDEQGTRPLTVEQGGESAGLPAAGQLEGNSYNPLGNPGVHHWQAGIITEPGLDERNNVFFAAIQMTRMPMAVTDPNKRDNPIVFVNNAFEDLTGYKRDEVMGRNCRFLQGEQTDPAAVEEVRRAVKEQRAVAVDLINYKADGTPFWNGLFIGPIFDQNGKLLYYFSSQIDVTKRRVSEQAFRQAQKMEAIGQLTAGLAHDFNNLLQVISGNLELVEHRLKDDDIACSAVAHARSATEKGARLTQQLLTFARKQRLEPRRVNLNNLVIEFSEMLVRTLGERTELRLDLKPGLPHCVVDPTHMEMALLNVLINARDAMPGGGKVTVATATITSAERAAAHHLPPRSYVVLCVIDEGEGMSEEVRHRATEPFFTTKGPGTGLGLAMVHGFVQQSQGRLEIESELGQGTTVRMIFPTLGEKPPVPQEAGSDALAPDPALSRHQQTILVVEDSDDVRNVAEAFLRSGGYRVLAASSGEQAMTLVEGEGSIDLLFTDVIMPGGMNGVVLARRLREKQPQLPVLLTTGYTEELSGEHLATPAFSMLSKPYRRTELLDRVRAALSHKADALLSSSDQNK